jgi:hypothetical protein
VSCNVRNTFVYLVSVDSDALLNRQRFLAANVSANLVRYKDIRYKDIGT